PWVGRRQLFVRFAAEAETATMFTAAALGQELKRLAQRDAYHSIAISGRDPLANCDYLVAVFDTEAPPLPVMLDTDGERPDELGKVIAKIDLVQVTVAGAPSDSSIERALASVKVAASHGVEHALVLCPNEQATDAMMLRAVEQVHAVSEKAQVVVHPPLDAAIGKDRRWVTLIERAAAVHPDVRLMLRLAAPVGMT
ncbi:MAG: hypothetical protein H0X64_15640, partial [Gemmatimonadaceae bacterium]|nr:hypothetical protein [Gemmatimonadaceae bacterium]